MNYREETGVCANVSYQLGGAAASQGGDPSALQGPGNAPPGWMEHTQVATPGAPVKGSTDCPLQGDSPSQNCSFKIQLPSLVGRAA